MEEIIPVTREQVAEIYVATFNRAPDTAGLDYWVDSGLTIEQIAASFFEQDETHEKYPDTLSNSEFVNTIYLNVYNRDADPDGLTYWVNELEAGTISRAEMIIAMVNGAQGTDQDTLDNKTEVGLYFAEKGTNLTYDQSVEAMKDVTSDPETVTDAKTEIDVWSSESNTIPLTKEIDEILGTDLDNTITALVAADTADNTLNPEDTINGGGGDNTLAFTNEAAAATTTAIAHMSNVATLAYTNSATAKQTINLAGTTGVQTISMDGASSAKTTFNEVVNIVALELDGTSAATTKVNYTAAAVIGDNTMSIANNTEAAQTVNVQGVENINLTSGTVAGVVNTILLRDTDLNKITVDGAGAMTLRTENANDTTASVIDLSAATGNIEVRAGIVDKAGATITSGGGADTINLNTGADTVVYTQASQSQAFNADAIVGFLSVDDTISLTDAIENAKDGSSTGDDATGKFGTLIAPMDPNQTFDNNVVMVDTVNDIAYVDVNTNNKFDANDMIIDLNGASVAAEDFMI